MTVPEKSVSLPTTFPAEKAGEDNSSRSKETEERRRSIRLVGLVKPIFPPFKE